MRKIITILYCLLLGVAVYGTQYTPHNCGAMGYNPTAQGQSYQYQFKSTSSYTPIVNYQTVKPLDQNGFVSDIYTTNHQVYRPRRAKNNLDLDEDDVVNGSDTPIGEPLIPLTTLMLIYIIYRKHKRKKSAC